MQVGGCWLQPDVLLMQGKERVEVGHVAVQGQYLARRLMMVQGQELDHLHTVSGGLSVTRLLAVLLELGQGDRAGLGQLARDLSL